MWKKRRAAARVSENHVLIGPESGEGLGRNWRIWSGTSVT